MQPLIDRLADPGWLDLRAGLPRAAYELADPRLLPVLQRLHDAPEGDSGDEQPAGWLGLAIRACTPPPCATSHPDPQFATLRPDEIVAAATASHAPPPHRYRALLEELQRRSETALRVALDLCADADEMVRYEAIGSLATQPFDCPKVRAALIARLDDEPTSVRAHALFGLAKLQDKRALEPLVRALTGSDIHGGFIQAAALLGDPRLLGPLQSVAAQSRGHGRQDEVDHAIAACANSSGNDPGSGARTVTRSRLRSS